MVGMGGKKAFLCVLTENRSAALSAKVGNPRVFSVGGSTHYKISHPGGANHTEH